MIQPINVIEQENKKLFKNGSVYDNITTKRNDYKSKIDNITYIRLPENSGGAGGFYEGISFIGLQCR